MKLRCPRCQSGEFSVMGCDNWAIEDVTTFVACDECNLLYWYSSFLNEIRTNGNDADRAFSRSDAPEPSSAP